MHLHVVHKALFRTCCGNRSVKDNTKMLQQIFVKSRKVEKKKRLTESSTPQKYPLKMHLIIWSLFA